MSHTDDLNALYGTDLLTALSDAPVTGEPNEEEIRGTYPECTSKGIHNHIVSRFYYAKGRGYLLFWLCWGSLQSPATCDYRRCL